MKNKKTFTTTIENGVVTNLQYGEWPIILAPNKPLSLPLFHLLTIICDNACAERSKRVLLSLAECRTILHSNSKDFSLQDIYHTLSRLEDMRYRVIYKYRGEKSGCIMQWIDINEDMITCTLGDCFFEYMMGGAIHA